MKISQELLQAIVNYLSTKPFKEVINLISAIERELKTVPQVPEGKTPTERKAEIQEEPKSE